MVTFRIELGKPKNDKSIPVYIRITKDRVSKRIRFIVNASQDDVTSDGVIKDARLDMMLNDTILDYKHRLYDAGFVSEKWDIDKIYDYLTSNDDAAKKEFKLDFIEFGRKEIQKMKADNRLKTAEGYTSALNKLVAFLGRDTIDINEINKAMLLRFKEWYEEQGGGGRAFELYMSNLQTLHNKAKLLFNDEDDEKLNIRLSPFKAIPFKRTAAERRSIEKRAISPTALRYLRNVPKNVLSERASMAQDAFMLSFALCGMNATDMLSHKQEEDCPKDVIEYYRAKTVGRSGNDAFIRMHIHPMFKDEHERLKGKRHTWFFAERYSTPNTFTTALNKGLYELMETAVIFYANQWGLHPITSRKSILKRLELPDTLTFYSARHSFATIAANDCRIPTEIIDRCLCHVVKSVAASSYIKKDYRFTDETIEAVVGFVFGEN